MTDHDHTELVPGCYRCDLNKDELPTPIAAAAEAMEDAALRLLGHDLGTIYRDRIATETVTAALDAIDADAIMADHRDLVWVEPAAAFECIGCDYQIPGGEVTETSACEHQAAVLRAALLKGTAR